MSKLREAAQLALEALELTQDGSEFSVHLPEEWSLAAAKDYKTMKEAIAALRAALSEEAMQRLTDMQQEMEPVACHHEWFKTGAMQPGECRCIHCGKWGGTGAKREWVGLTDEEELWEMWVESPSDVLRFAHAVEAKLREKNG